LTLSPACSPATGISDSRKSWTACPVSKVAPRRSASVTRSGRSGQVGALPVPTLDHRPGEVAPGEHGALEGRIRRAPAPAARSARRGPRISQPPTEKRRPARPAITRPGQRQVKG